MIGTLLRWAIAIGLTAWAGPLCWEFVARIAMTNAIHQFIASLAKDPIAAIIRAKKGIPAIEGTAA